MPQPVLRLVIPFLALFGVSLNSTAGAIDAVTTGTVILEDVFAPSAPLAWQRGSWTGPVREPLEQGPWRLPRPVALPEMTGAMELPRVRGLAELNDPTLDVKRDPFFSEIGRTADIPPTEARVTIRSEFPEVRVRYRLQSLDRPDSPPIVLLHGGQIEETFRVPSGNWDVQIEFWRPTDLRPTIRWRFPRQRLNAGQAYQGLLASKEERPLLRRLESLGSSASNSGITRTTP